jgi:hypothetical protein
MIKKISMLIITVFVLLVGFQTMSFAGKAPVKVIHEKSDIKVVKYEFRYGTIKETDPADYTNYIMVVPETPVAGEATCEVEFDGSGTYYVSVKDYYADGTESEYTEPIEINNIPAAPVLTIISN